MKKTNGRSRANPHNTTLPDYREEVHRKENKQHSETTNRKSWHDAHPSMMHVRFKYAWHGKVHKQSYKLSEARYATPLHIDETPHSSYLVLSRLCTQQY